MNSNKIAYGVFHINGRSSVRDILNDKMCSQLSKDFNPLVFRCLPSEQAHLLRPFIKSNLKSGEVGLIGSTIIGWMEFLESNNDIAIFCEDDIIISDDFNSQVLELIEYLPIDWEVLSLFTHPEQRGGGSSDHIVPRLQDSLAFCYIITRSACRKGIQILSTGLDRPIDSFIFSDVFSGYATVREIVAHSSMPWEGWKVPENFHNNFLDIIGGMRDNDIAEMKDLPSTIQETPNIQIGINMDDAVDDYFEQKFKDVK